ncbi:MAG: protease inhibitor I42 family protein [Chitinivibrionales bacterium]|nr:protease inhibitor I42 family protein [Chitinivibrionales bacterium]
MKLKCVNFIAALNVLFLLNCSPAKNSTPLVFTMADNGTTQNVSNGMQFEIHLSAAPSTGYYWRTPSIDTTKIRFDGEHFVPSDNLVGSGGAEVLRFSVIDTGTSILKIKYEISISRPPSDSFSINIVAN